MHCSPIQSAVLIAILFVHKIGYAQSTDIIIDGRDSTAYRIVGIGTQTWMAENLNFTSADSWCYADSQRNCEVYGRLYTWEAARDACPDGWHLPGEEEWRILERFLGMSEKEVEIMYMRGETTGTKLKSKTDWEPDSIDDAAQDIVGFNARPGGYRLFLDGSFVDIGQRGSWWSSTPDGKYAMRRSLFLDKGGIDRDAATRTNGFSVRCLMD